MKLIKKMFVNSVDYLENSQYPMHVYLLTFLFSITLRNALEFISDATSMTWEVFFHYYLAYSSLAVCLILLFHLGTKMRVSKLIRLILPCFIILCSAPIIDLFLSGGGGFDMAYFQPPYHDHIVIRFFTFFGSLEPMAITPGMRIEIFLVLFAVLIYFRYKLFSWIKALWYMILTYTVIFLFCSLPYLLKFILHSFSLSLWPTDFVFSSFYLIILFVLGNVLVFFEVPKKYKMFISDIPWERVFHYQLLVLFGWVLAIKITPVVIDTKMLLSVILTEIGLFFSCLYSLVTNNIADQEIDVISNPNRILVSEKIEYSLYKRLQWPFLILSLIYGLIAGFASFFYQLIFIANYFVYSVKPLRIKRIPYFSKYCIAFNSIVSVMIGFYLVTYSLYQFPLKIIVFFLTIYVASIQFIDLKDIAGDSKAKINTIPVIFGERLSKILIGIAFVLTFLSVHTILNKIILLPFLLCAGVSFFILINSKYYSDKRVFWFYLICLMFLMGYIFVFGL